MYLCAKPGEVCTHAYVRHALVRHAPHVGPDVSHCDCLEAICVFVCVCVCVCVCHCVFCLQGLKHAIVQRLPDFIFTNKRIHVAPWLASRQEETLTPVLAHIPLLNAPYATVDLARWTWTLEMLDLLRGALPTLQHLKLSINTTQVVADDIFSSMLRLGSRMESLSLGGVNLQSHRYKTRRWPWAKCVIQSINVAGVIKLPRPNRHTVVQFGSLQLAGASQVGHACITTRHVYKECNLEHANSMRTTK